MVWRVLKHYGIDKATAELDDFAAAVDGFDPQAASGAQTAMIEAELDKLGGRLAETEAELRREHLKTRELTQTFEHYLRAARLLEAQFLEAQEPRTSAATEASLVKVVERLEQMKPELEHEARDDRDAQVWHGALRRTCDALAGKLRGAESELAAADGRRDARNPKRARAGSTPAGAQERRAGDAAGLTSALGALNVALDTMNRETAKVHAETEALKLKVGLLQADRLDSDPNIAAALAMVRGKAAGGGRSLSDRLAALSGSGDSPPLMPAA